MEIRAGEGERLAAVLRGAASGLSIVDVHGPGGVGKTWLVRHVLDAMDAAGSGWLVLRVDGSQSRTDLMALLSALFPRALAPPAPPGVDLFPHLRRVEVEVERLLRQAEAELLAGAPAEVRQAVLALLRAGQRVNDIVPESRRWVDVAALGDPQRLAAAVDDVADALKALGALHDVSWLPGPLRTALGATLSARVRRDARAAATDEVMVDLTAVLHGWQKSDWWRLTERRVAGLDRLLLVLDDWEALAPVLQPWVLGSLVERLASAPFATALLVVGRDPLAAIDPGWAQHAARYIKDVVALAPFSREEAGRWMADRGVPEQRREAVWEATRGYPFLLDALADGEPESMLSLRQFHNRVTRWMTPAEEAWLDEVVHLDRVDGDTLQRFFVPDEALAVLTWFEREASVRDPDAPVWRVRPWVREKLLAYQEARFPSRYAERRARAAG